MARYTFDRYCEYLTKNGLKEDKKSIAKELEGFLNCLYFNDLILTEEYDRNYKKIEKLLLEK